MKMRYQPPQLSSTLSKNLKTGTVSPGNLDTNQFNLKEVHIVQGTYSLTRCEQEGVTHFPLSGIPGTVYGLGFHSVSEGNELKVKEHRVRMLAKKCQEIVYFVYCKHALTIA